MRPYRIVIAGMAMLPWVVVSQGQMATEMPSRTVHELPEVGHRISPAKGKTHFQCMRNSAQFDECFEALFQGVRFVVSYKKVRINGYEITRVSTHDPKFSTPSGLHVGDVVTVRNSSEFVVAPYFEVYVATGERWMPVVGMLGSVNWQPDDSTDKLKSTLVSDLHPTPENPIRLTITGFVMSEGGKSGHPSQVPATLPWEQTCLQ